MRLIGILILLLNIGMFPFSAGAHGDDTHFEIFPSSVAYQAGEEISVTVLLNTVENATSFRVHLLYDANMLTVKTISPNASDFPIWLGQEATDGVVDLEASVPAPGFLGETTVATVVFQATKAGSSEIKEDTGASLVLNAENENILLSKEEVAAAETSEVPSREQAPASNLSIGVIVAVLTAVGVGGGVVWFTRKKE